MNKTYVKMFMFVLLSFVIIMGAAHFILIDRVGFWRLIYPVQAQFARWNIRCSENAPDWMQDSLKYIVSNQKNLSNQIAYLDHKKKLHTCESGWRGMVLFSEHLTANDRFRYASMTKLVTNDAVLQLIRQNKLHLNDKMVSFFDELDVQNFKDARVKDITIRDLLQQRSGFDRMQSEDVVFAMNKTPWCPSRLMQLVKLKLDFDPNQKYAYDNRNTCLLGAVIERVTGQPYRNYIQNQYQLESRNIKFIRNFYYLDEVNYDFRNNDFWMLSQDLSFDFNALSSSAGLSGSAEALVKLIDPMLAQPPLNIMSIAQDNLAQCQISTFKSCNGYGMWQYQATAQQPVMYFRNGGFPAVTSLAVVTEDKRIMVWIGNGATLYGQNHDDNMLEKYFYQALLQK